MPIRLGDPSHRPLRVEHQLLVGEHEHALAEALGGGERRVGRRRSRARGRRPGRRSGRACAGRPTRTRRAGRGRSRSTCPRGKRRSNCSRFARSIARRGVKPTTARFGLVYRYWLSSQALKYDVKYASRTSRSLAGALGDLSVEDRLLKPRREEKREHAAPGVRHARALGAPDPLDEAAEIESLEPASRAARGRAAASCASSDGRSSARTGRRGTRGWPSRSWSSSVPPERWICEISTSGSLTGTTWSSRARTSAR